MHTDNSIMTKKTFTFRQKSPLKQARLDCLLISDNLLSSLSKASIHLGYISDHSSVSINITFNKFKQGKGF